MRLTGQTFQSPREVMFMQLVERVLGQWDQLNDTIRWQTPGPDWLIWAFISTMGQLLFWMGKFGYVAVLAVTANAKFWTHPTTSGLEQRQ